MSIENSPEQWHNRIQEFCRTSQEVIERAQSVKVSPIDNQQELYELARSVDNLQSNMYFLQKKDPLLTTKVMEPHEQEYLQDLLKKGNRDLDRITRLISSIFYHREKITRAEVQAATSAELQEVEQFHQHIQQRCQVSQDLMQKMRDLRGELDAQDLRKGRDLREDRDNLLRLATEDRAHLLALDDAICREKKLSAQNRIALTALLAQFQKNMDAIAKVINPLLYERYTAQRGKLPGEKKVDRVEPEGIPSDQNLRVEYAALLEQAEAQLARGEELDDTLFAKLVSMRKEITGLFFMSAEPPEPKSLQWHINYALLKESYQKAIAEGNRAMRQKIGFLMLQYLAKIAPWKRETNRDVGVSASGMAYHRLGFGGTLYIQAQEALFKKITPGLFEEVWWKTYLFLLDHQEIDDLLSLKYELIEAEDINLIAPDSREEGALIKRWSVQIGKALSEGLKDGVPVSPALKKRILFDFTRTLGQDIYCSEANKQQKTEDLKAKTKRIESLLDRAILLACVPIMRENPLVDVMRLRQYIKSNSIAMTRGSVNNVSFVAQLPWLQGRKTAELPEGHPFTPPETQWLGKFIQEAGLKIGAMRLGYQFFDLAEDEAELQTILQGSSLLPEIEYAPSGPKSIYYPSIVDLLQLRLLDQLSKTAFATQERAPQVSIPLQSTLTLFKGLLQEISLQLEREGEAGPIHELYNSPMVQSTLHRLMQHLAAANQNPYQAEAFTNAIQLAHAELTALLTIFQPYSAEDFPRIFKEKVTHIPERLQDYVEVGIGTSAMTVFTMVNACVSKTVPEREAKKVVSEGIYYEEKDLLKGVAQLSQVLADDQVNQVDLYVAQINHGIDADLNHTHYEPTNVIDEVEAILGAKPATERLTVALDCTIDFVESAQVQAILLHFSEQIREGRLNFVFFGSGQKYAMFGQDNYYGAPFYVINNGDEHWAPFKAMTSEERFHTDLISQQWFCLSTQYALGEMESYRGALFKNTREALTTLASFAPQENKKLVVSTVDEQMIPSFIDVKFSQELSAMDRMRARNKLQSELERIFKRDGQILDFRGSFGFAHTNMNSIGVVSRITLGLDPKDIDRVAEALLEVEKFL